MIETFFPQISNNFYDFIMTQDVRLDDAGQYQCFAENKFGREEANGKVIVRGTCVKG